MAVLNQPQPEDAQPEVPRSSLHGCICVQQDDEGQHMGLCDFVQRLPRLPACTPQGMTRSPKGSLCRAGNTLLCRCPAIAQGLKTGC